MDKFDRILSSVINSHLGLRSRLIGYQYSEINFMFITLLDFLHKTRRK